MTDLPAADVPSRPAAQYPDGGHTYFWAGADPAVTVRSSDGVSVEFRPYTGSPRLARVRFAGLEVKALRLDVDASVDPDGRIVSFQGSKTGVSGADGGGDLPANIRKAAQVLCCKRAREARRAIAAAAGLRTARPGAREGQA
jgi:hypothetical protein